MRRLRPQLHSPRMALGRQLASGLCLLVAAGALLGCGDDSGSDAEIPPEAAANLEQKLDRIQERAAAGKCTGPNSATSSLESLREAMGTEPLSSIEEGLAADLEELIDRLAEQLARDCEPAPEAPTTEETTSTPPVTTEPTTTEPTETTTTKTTTRTTTTQTTTTRKPPPPGNGPPDNGPPGGSGNEGPGGANGGVGPGRDRGAHAIPRGGEGARAGAKRRRAAGFPDAGSKGSRDR